MICCDRRLLEATSVASCTSLNKEKKLGLMFPRVAKNFVKAGYFPTDEVTLERALNALDVDGPAIRILDPCAGEGVALAEVKGRLNEQGAAVQSFGVEIDAERAWHAKTMLDVVAHADVNDVLISQRSFGLLWLNPSYGDAVADKARTGDRSRADRLEKIFCRRSFGLLQAGGILILIVPNTVFDEELATLVARHFEQITFWRAPEQKFRQAVLFGVKRRPASPPAKLVQALVAFSAEPGTADELPVNWPHEPYRVPPVAPEPLTFRVVPLEPRQLAAELSRHEAATLWPRFAQHFARHVRAPRRPLRRLSKWHLALALAAGQIGGIVRAPSGRTLLIKGDTFKEKEQSVTQEIDGDGAVRETRVLTDKFVPVIKAIDLTPGERFGQVVTIR